MRQYHSRSDVHPDIGKAVFPIRGVGYGGSLVAKRVSGRIALAEMRTPHPYTF
jgi:hypothetical protein